MEDLLEGRFSVSEKEVDPLTAQSGEPQPPAEAMGRPPHLFDVHSLDDLDLLPNLKLFHGADAPELMLPDGLEILAAGVSPCAERRLERVCSTEIAGAAEP